MADAKVIDAEPEPPVSNSVDWFSTGVTSVVAMVCMCTVVHFVLLLPRLHAAHHMRPTTHAGTTTGTQLSTLIQTSSGSIKPKTSSKFIISTTIY